MSELQIAIEYDYVLISCVQEKKSAVHKPDVNIIPYATISFILIENIWCFQV